MKCEECTTHALEEFLDGELDARRAAETEAHLAACRACALRYDELLDEQAMYASYERDLEATPQALWAGVASRIAAEQPRAESRAGAGFLHRVRARLASLLVAPRFSPAMTAAMMLLAIGATAAVMRYMNSQPVAPSGLAVGSQPTVAATPSNIVRQPTPEPSPSVATPAPQNGAPAVDANAQPDGREKTRTPETPRRRDEERKPIVPANDPAQLLAARHNGEILRRQRATERLVREAESKYLAAIRMLSEDVNSKRTRLDPQVAARFDETLATIDRSIAETRRTVLRQRNDPVAVQYMLSAYAKKVEVMREMAALD
ncbi:MAG TPA: zf-HC2 domain-containing protein [Pyrinomonadaceae bacterium]|nr:zf-HC2 domain-containing protein [Pyrinomonadaceae bacterium]